ANSVGILLANVPSLGALPMRAPAPGGEHMNDMSLSVHPEDGAATPDRRPLWLPAPRLLQERGEALVFVVLGVSAHVFHDGIEDVCDVLALLGVVLLDPVRDACQRRGEKLAPFVKVLPQRQLLGCERALERRCLRLLDAEDDRVRLGGPPHRGNPGIPGTRGNRPPLAIDPICFRSLRISANCFTSWFTSDTVVPEPAAIRRRRDPLMSVGSARSALVMDKMIASTLRISRSASGPSGSCFAMLPRPGIIFRRSPSGPIFLTCCSCE